MRVATPGQGIARQARCCAFHEDACRADPRGARGHGVGAISLLPLSGQGPLQPYAYDEETARNWESATADGLRITPGYLSAIGAIVRRRPRFRR